MTRYSFLLAAIIAACHPTQKSASDKETIIPLDLTITDKHWKLIELGGQAVGSAEEPQEEVFLIFHADDGRVTGNGSCNNISGSYEVGQGNRISFSHMVSTRRACPEMQLEDRFLKVFDSVDSYALRGDTLSLSRAKMAPLARFVVFRSE